MFFEIDRSSLLEFSSFFELSPKGSLLSIETGPSSLRPSYSHWDRAMLIPSLRSSATDTLPELFVLPAFTCQKLSSDSIDCWEKLSWGVSKPGGFPNRAVSHFFRERSRLFRRPFWDCSLLVRLIGRERGKGQIGKIPGESSDKSGKSRKNWESPKNRKRAEYCFESTVLETEPH